MIRGFNSQSSQIKCVSLNEEHEETSFWLRKETQRESDNTKTLGDPCIKPLSEEQMEETLILLFRLCRYVRKSLLLLLSTVLSPLGGFIYQDEAAAASDDLNKDEQRQRFSVICPRTAGQ